jgi:hypothetical protein
MRNLIFVMLPVWWVSCCPGAILAPRATAVVQDYSGVEGCQQLLALSDGSLLEAVNLVEGSPLSPGQQVRFHYKTLQAAQAGCMMASKVVEVHCLKDVARQELPTADCVDTSNPFAVPWMDRAIDRHNPTRIIKYRMGNKWAYLFQGLPSSFLFSCEGRLLCETRGDEHDDCHVTYLNRFNKGKIIWQGEGVWD